MALWWHMGTNCANRFDVVLVVTVNGAGTSTSATLFLNTLESMKRQCKGGGAPIQMPANVLQLVSPWTVLQIYWRLFSYSHVWYVFLL